MCAGYIDIFQLDSVVERSPVGANLTAVSDWQTPVGPEESWTERGHAGRSVDRSRNRHRPCLRILR